MTLLKKATTFANTFDCRKTSKKNARYYSQDHFWISDRDCIKYLLSGNWGPRGVPGLDHRRCRERKPNRQNHRQTQSHRSSGKRQGRGTLVENKRSKRKKKSRTKEKDQNKIKFKKSKTKEKDRKKMIKINRSKTNEKIDKMFWVKKNRRKKLFYKNLKWKIVFVKWIQIHDRILAFKLGALIQGQSFD